MSRRRVQKRDLKSQLEELDREIALLIFKKKYRKIKYLRKKVEILREQFIEENIKYYESCNTG